MGENADAMKEQGQTWVAY